MAEEMERLGGRAGSVRASEIVRRPRTDSLEEAAPVCPLCNGTRWVRVDVPFGHPRWGSIDPCSCWDQEGAQERRERLLRYSNLGVLARFTFATLDEEGRQPGPGRPPTLPSGGSGRQGLRGVAEGVAGVPPGRAGAGRRTWRRQ